MRLLVLGRAALLNMKNAGLPSSRLLISGICPPPSDFGDVSALQEKTDDLFQAVAGDKVA